MTHLAFVSRPAATRGAAGLALFAALAIAALSLWLRMAFPVHAIGHASYDDALFVRSAYALAGHQWLGPFDQLTLAKGAGYPAFIHFAAALGLPLKLAEQAVYLAVAALLAWQVAVRLGRRLPGLLLFAVFAFNPALWHPELARVIRENLYLSQSLALIVLYAMLLFPRHGRARKRPWLLALATGLVLGSYWVTREEGIWLLPALAVLAGMGALAAWRRGRRLRRISPARPDAWRLAAAFLAPLALSVAAAGLVVNGVKAANLWHYGVFIANEFHATDFKNAYGALARIRHDQPRRYVVFPADARQRAYAASPAARELQPFLEGDSGQTWRRIGCGQTGISPCPEILSGWFMWALRDATSLAGHYRSAPEALAFYRRLADEINTACDSGAIPCGPARHSLAPALDAGDIAPTLASLRSIAPKLLGLGDGWIGVAPSVGPRERIDWVAQMVGPIALPAPERHEIRGWIAADAGLPLLTLHAADGTPRPGATLQLEEAPDVRQAHPGHVSARFRVRSDCPSGECLLAVRWQGQGGQMRNQPGAAADGPGFKAYVEASHDRTLDPAQHRLQHPQSLARKIATAYRLAWPWLTLAGAAVLLVAAIGWLRRPRTDFLLALGLSALAAVAVRALLLAYLDATSIPSSNVLYASPASGMVLCVPVLALLVAWRARVASRSHLAP